MTYIHFTEEQKYRASCVDPVSYTHLAGEHGTELVVDGVKPERLEQFRSVLDAYGEMESYMGPVQ